MTPQELETVGRALYGSVWQSELARALGISDRTIRRWHAGDTHPFPALRSELAALCKERGLELTTLSKRLAAPE